MNARAAWRSLLVATLAAGLTVGLVWWRHTRATQATRAGVPLWSGGALDAIDVQTRHGEFRFVREAGSWHMRAPKHGPADPSALEALETRIGELRMHDAFTPASADLSTYGLEPPAARVRLSGEGKEERWDVGLASRYDGRLYLRRAGAAQVGLTDAALGYAIDRDVDQWRDRRLLPCDAAEIREVRVEIDGRVIALTRSGATAVWTLAEGEGAAHPERSARFVQRLVGLRFEREVDAQEAKAKPDAVRWQLDVRCGEQRSRSLLWLAAPPRRSVAERDGSGTVWLLGAAASIDELSAALQGVTDRRLLHFDLSDVARVEIDGPYGAFALARDAAQDWTLHQGEGTSPAGRSDVALLLYKLASLEPLGPAAPSVAAARAQVRLLAGDGRPLASLALGDLDRDPTWIALGGGPRVGLSRARLEGIALDPAVFAARTP